MGVTARVTVKLDIDVASNWGDNCTVGQVKKQALDKATYILAKILRTTDVKLIGKAKCISIIYTE